MLTHPVTKSDSCVISDYLPVSGETSVSGVLAVDSVLQRLQLSLHLSRQISSNLLTEVGSQLLCFLLPERLGHIKQGSHIHIGTQTFSVDGAIFWQPADNALLGHLVLPLPTAAFKDPLQDTGIFTKAGPEEGTCCRVLSEPIDVKDLRQMSFSFSVLHAQPVSEVVAKVVTEEGSHGKRVVHNYLACGKRNEMILTI